VSEETRFVIVSEDGGFWSGTRWEQEYPEALTFRTFEGACAEAKRSQLGFLTRRMVVADYGLKGERVEARFPDSLLLTGGAK
jgi:hypothetical protein